MKIWSISVAGAGKRIKLKAFANKQDAVAEMEEIRDFIDRRSRHSFSILEHVDDLLVVTSYSDDQSIRHEDAVMTEVSVTETSSQKKPSADSRLANNSWQHLVGDDQKNSLSW
jgi:hypothetical protein